MEAIRALANLHAAAPSKSDLAEIAARKTVWRTFGLMVRLRRVPDADDLLRRLNEVTDLHARTVGDLILYALPADFGAAIARAPDPLPYVPRETLLNHLRDSLARARRLAGDT